MAKYFFTLRGNPVFCDDEREVDFQFHGVEGKDVSGPYKSDDELRAAMGNLTSIAGKRVQRFLVVDVSIQHVEASVQTKEPLPHGDFRHEL